MVDIALVVGVLLTLYGLMQAIGSMIEGGQTGIVTWSAVTVLGLLAFIYGYVGQPDGFHFSDIPQSFIRVLAMITL